MRKIIETNTLGFIKFASALLHCIPRMLSISVMVILPLCVYYGYIISSMKADSLHQPMKLPLSAHDKAYQAFEADRYDETIRYGRLMLANTTDPIERIEASELILLGIRNKSGYATAIKEAESLLSSIKNDILGDKRHANYLNEAIIELHLCDKQYKEAIAEKYKIIQQTPQQSRRPVDDLWIARYRLFTNGYDGGINAFKNIMRKYPKSIEDFKSRLMVSYMYERSGDMLRAKQTWRDTAIVFSDTKYGEVAVEKWSRLLNSNTTECINVMREFAQEYPFTRVAAAAYYKIGQLTEKTSSAKDDNALEIYHDAIKQSPNSVAAELSVNRISYIYESIRRLPEEDINEMMLLSNKYNGTETSARAELCSIMVKYRSQLATHEVINALHYFRRQNPSTRAAEDARYRMISIFTEIANRYIKDDDVPNAIIAWKQRLELQDDNYGKAESLMLIATNTMGLGAYREARTYLQLIISNPELKVSEWHQNAEYLDATALYYLHDYDNAIPALLLIKKSDSDLQYREGAERMLANISRSRLNEAPVDIDKPSSD